MLASLQKANTRSRKASGKGIFGIDRDNSYGKSLGQNRGYDGEWFRHLLDPQPAAGS